MCLEEELGRHRDEGPHGAVLSPRLWVRFKWKSEKRAPARP